MVFSSDKKEKEVKQKMARFRKTATVYVGSRFAKGGVRQYSYKTSGKDKKSFLDNVKKIHEGRMIKGKIRTIKIQ